MDLKELPDDVLEIVIRKACPASFLWLLFVNRRIRYTAIQFMFPEKDDRYSRLYFENRLFRTLRSAILRNDRRIAYAYMYDHHWVTLIKYGYTCCISWLLVDANIDVNMLLETCQHCQQEEIESILRAFRRIKERKKTYKAATMIKVHC